MVLPTTQTLFAFSMSLQFPIDLALLNVPPPLVNACYRPRSIPALKTLRLVGSSTLAPLAICVHTMTGSIITPLLPPPWMSSSATTVPFKPLVSVTFPFTCMLRASPCLWFCKMFSMCRNFTATYFRCHTLPSAALRCGSSGRDVPSLTSTSGLPAKVTCTETST